MEPLAEAKTEKAWQRLVEIRDDNWRTSVAAGACRLR
jgi:hypothetical protein